MRLNVTLVILVTVAALVGAGCGGSGDGGSSDPTSVDGSSSSQASNAQNASGEGAAGDGGGATGDGGSSEALSKAEFIKQADTICRKGGGRIFNELQRHKLEYGRGFGRTPTKKQNEEGLVDLVLPVLREEIEEIDALVPPPGDEAEIDAMLEAFEEGVEKTEAKPSLAESPGPSNPLDKAATLSQQYGFQDCGG